MQKQIRIISLILIHFVVEHRSLEIYWNIPSFMCRKHNIDFSQIAANFDGIRMNDKDNFQGDKLTIMYDPGFFPALLQSGSRLEQRNGGVPQQGNLSAHLAYFKQHVDELVPDVNNKGLVIVDFESWRPTFRQNFGALQPYKDLSIKLVQNEYPFWPKRTCEAEAERRFESSGREFVEQTIMLAKKLRPLSRWGYYAFPYCFNKGKTANCPAQVQKENDKMGWMFFHEDVVLPSVYLQESLSSREKMNVVGGRISEATRMSKAVSSERKKVYVYIRYVYTDSLKYLSDNDFLMVFQMSKDLRADGVILWGSSFDLNSRKKCEGFAKYFKENLGPIAQSFASDDISVKSLS